MIAGPLADSTPHYAPLDSASVELTRLLEALRIEDNITPFSLSFFCKNVHTLFQSLKMALANKKVEQLDRPDEYQKIFQ